ncbi:hypothetical protein Tco_0497588 [Tanacetum coccineum]
MANLKFADTHNMVAFLSKPEESDGFEQIVDFLNAHPIIYALTVNPTIYISCIEQFRSTVKAKTINGEVQLYALVDGKKVIITESTVRRDLQLEDAEGVDCLPNSTIFEQLTLMRGNTLRSDEDRLKLDELMALCTTLQTRVLDLEKTKTTQQNEIDSLKRRVKKLKKKRSLRTHKLKRLYKVSLTARVESSGDEEDLGEDTSKQGRRINAINADEDITLVNVQDDADNEMFDVNVLNSEEVFVVGQNEKLLMKLAREKAKKEKEANIALIEEWDDIQEKIDVDYQLAERLQAQEQEELSDAEKAILFQQLLEKRRKHFAAKRAEEKRNKPPTKAQQRQIMCTYLKNMEGYKLKYLKSKGFDAIQEMFDRAFKRVNTFEDFRIKLVERKEKRAGEELIQESSKKQKVEDDKETSKLKQCLEIIPDEEEVTIDAIPLVF